VTPRTTSWTRVHRTTLAFVVSDWSLNSASRSYIPQQSAKAQNTQLISTYPLKHLLPPNILQPRIQILDLLHNALNLALITTLNLAALSNGQIQSQFDISQHLAAHGPPAGGRVRGLETDLVVSGVVGNEGEFTGGGTALGDDAVVVVKDFVDEDEDLKGGV